MSQFYAFDFVFDDIPSHKFDLKIITFEDGGLFNGVGSSDVNIIEQRVLRKSRPYYLGRTQETKLEFPLTFGTAAPISGMDRDLISTWLFGRSTYRKLYILQDDLGGAYFNCFLTKPEPLYVGGLNYAFTCNVVCDSPWAYKPEVIISGCAVRNNSSINIYNNSSEDEYLYPKFSFEIVNDRGPGWGYKHIIISNSQDSENNRVAVFTHMAAGDKVTVDNDLQIINFETTTTDFPRGDTILGTARGILEAFNKKWLRLIPKYNQINFLVQGWNADLTYQFRYTERLKIGG